MKVSLHENFQIHGSVYPRLIKIERMNRTGIAQKRCLLPKSNNSFRKKNTVYELS